MCSASPTDHHSPHGFHEATFHPAASGTANSDDSSASCTQHISPVSNSMGTPGTTDPMIPETSAILTPPAALPGPDIEPEPPPTPGEDYCPPGFTILRLASFNVGPFQDPNRNHALLHTVLTEHTLTTDIMVTLYTPYRRNPTDDRFGNAQYIMISHPDWQWVVPSIKLVVQSRTAIWINKLFLTAHDVTVFPAIPDVPLVNITIVAKNSLACLECRHNNAGTTKYLSQSATYTQATLGMNTSLWSTTSTPRPIVSIKNPISRTSFHHLSSTSMPLWPSSKRQITLCQALPRLLNPCQTPY